MNVAWFGRHLRRRCDFHVSRAPLHSVAARAFDGVVTFIRREQARSRANLDLLQIGRARNLSGWITPGRGVHDVDPDRQRQFTAKRAAINFLRLVEAHPNRAGKIRIVTGKKCVGKIVGSASFARCRHFLQAKLCASSFAGSRLERIDKAGMHFISCFGFDDSLPGPRALCIPYHASILFFYAFQNMRRARTPAAVRKYRVSERELGECDLAAAKKCRRIRTKRGTNPRRRTKLQY